MQYSSHGWNAESRVLFETNPLKPLGDLLEREALLTNRYFLAITFVFLTVLLGKGTNIYTDHY
jgi:hypothetical protein